MFEFDEINREYVAEIDGIQFVCESVRPGYEEYAQQLADVYYEKITDIAEFMLPAVVSVYGKMSREDLVGNLGMPQVCLDTDELAYFRHTLDREHVLLVEFDGLFDELMYFTIDG